MSLLNYISEILIHRSEERQKERDHEIHLRELDNQQIRESNICQSCESLKLEIAKLHDQNNKLIEGILEKPQEVVASQAPIEIGPKKGTKIPWAVRKAMLEAEDRAQAKIIAEHNRDAQAAAKVSLNTPVNGKGLSTVAELEQELEIS